MSTIPTTHSVARLSGFAAASLWHRRMARTGVHSIITKVQPRLCAELVLHPLPPIPRYRGASSFNDTRKASDVFRAA
jgi:hypothetical protein